MTTFNQIKGAIFDLDGVITDTARFHTQAWRQTADQVGVSWDDELQESLKGIGRMEALELILKHGHLEQNFTQGEKERMATEKNQHYLELVDTLTPADILPGMQTLLDNLSQKGYRIALASASKNAPRVLKNLGLTAYFPNIVDPATLTHGKPDPEIFIKAAASINLPPAACMGFEDAAAGVAGIKAADEVAIGIGDKCELRAADVVFTQTQDVTLANIQLAMNRRDFHA
jgi:beta-phosphoglucomutase